MMFPSHVCHALAVPVKEIRGANPVPKAVEV